MEYKVFPLSDTALTIDFGNVIDEEVNDVVMRLFKTCQKHPLEGVTELIPAYASLTICYDIFRIRTANPTTKTAFDFVKSYIEQLFKNIDTHTPTNSKLVTIPVIYDGEDLSYVAEHNKLSIEQVIEIHTSPTYRVFMMGFLPGFAYLGGLDERIATPRKSTPRMKVPAGSVGIAGKQTGIYPLESPGGWQLIGQTNLQLFTPNETSPTLLNAGDLVKFVRI